MAVSHLKDIVKKMAEGKKLDWPGSVDRIIWDAERKLNGGDIDLAKAMEMIKGAFEYKLEKLDYDYIEREIGYKLNK
jgi:hypothetical protein